MPTTNSWERAQIQSLANADNRGKGWTLDEIAFVEETLSEPCADVADCLRRSLYGVTSMRHLILTGVDVKGSDRGVYVEATVAVRVCPTHHLVLPVTGVCEDCQ